MPCAVPGIGDGWALKFAHPEQAIFIGPRMVGRGSPPLGHFLRVRGTVDSGNYNHGFQTRQLTVDSIIDTKEMPQPDSTRNYTWQYTGPTAYIQGPRPQNADAIS